MFTFLHLSSPALSLTRAPRFLRHQSIRPALISAAKPSCSRASMASSTATKCEWLVIIPDHEGALQKRLEVRAKHLENIKPEPEFWMLGGAFMGEKPKEGETPDMKGSAMIAYAASEEEVMERLKRDVYVTSGVWNLDKVQIWPFKSAVRKGL